MSDVMGIKDVADRLDRSVEGVRKMIERGNIPAPFKLGHRLAWRRVDFDQWLERKAAEAAQGVRRAG